MPRQPRLDIAHIPQHVVQRGNDRYRRTGTLWEDRCKTSLVDRETYLLHRYRYIELHPVRARMTTDPLTTPDRATPATPPAVTTRWSICTPATLRPAPPASNDVPLTAR